MPRHSRQKRVYFTSQRLGLVVELESHLSCGVAKVTDEGQEEALLITPRSERAFYQFSERSWCRFCA